MHLALAAHLLPAYANSDNLLQTPVTTKQKATDNGNMKSGKIVLVRNMTAAGSIGILSSVSTAMTKLADKFVPPPVTSTPIPDSSAVCIACAISTIEASKIDEEMKVSAIEVAITNVHLLPPPQLLVVLPHSLSNAVSKCIGLCNLYLGLVTINMCLMDGGIHIG